MPTLRMRAVPAPNRASEEAPVNLSQLARPPSLFATLFALALLVVAPGCGGSSGEDDDERADSRTEGSVVGDCIDGDDNDGDGDGDVDCPDPGCAGAPDWGGGSSG